MNLDYRRGYEEATKRWVAARLLGRQHMAGYWDHMRLVYERLLTPPKP